MSVDTSYTVPQGQKAPTSAALPSIQPTTNGTSLQAANASKMAGQAGGHTHIFLVTGPAGCGKSSVAEYLANALNMPYIEGDSVRNALFSCHADNFPRMSLRSAVTNMIIAGSSTPRPTSKR